MPTTWNRSPEEFHKIYLANTDAFYRIGSSQLAKDLDDFMTRCALGLWSKAGSITERHVEMANQIYSKGQPRPTWLLWNLTSAACQEDVFMPPVFFWNLAESDARRGTETSRTFIRMLTNILLYLAAVDDDVTYDEAAYITDCTDRLTAICDTTGVRKSREGLNPLDFVTSGEPSFQDKHKPQVQTTGGETKPEAEPEKEAEAEKPDFDTLMAELEDLVGLEEVKKDVKNLMNLVKVRKLREQYELPVPPMSLHMVFVGNPGTGKTTVARLVSGLYAAIGVLSKGQLVEVDRSGLVAGYVGQTALKTQEVIKSALGGVLFIDEAYSLSSGGENDFGREAIETLLKAMEDHRDDLIVIVAGYDLIVIVAGYTEPMEKFIHSNPGLESRFNKYFFFPDYNGEQLMEMFRIRCKKNGYTMTEETEKAAVAFFTQLYEERTENFGNGRDVRNVFEDMVVRQANRVAAMEEPSKEDLMAVLPEDLEDRDEETPAEEPAEEPAAGEAPAAEEEKAES